MVCVVMSDQQLVELTPPILHSGLSMYVFYNHSLVHVRLEVVFLLTYG